MAAFTLIQKTTNLVSEKKKYQKINLFDSITSLKFKLKCGSVWLYGKFRIQCTSFTRRSGKCIL